MRIRRPVFLTVLAITLVGRLDSVQAQRAGARWLSYEEAFAPPSGAPRRADAPLGDLPNITGWLDGARYLEVKTDADGERRMYAVSAVDGRSEVYRDYGLVKKELPKGVDPTRPAAHTGDFGRLVYLAQGDLYLYDAAAHALRRLTATPAPERNPRFSPDGRWVAYTRGNNLFAFDLEKTVEHQYTDDGSETILNGYSSWVYMEEILGRGTAHAAFWWAPDSTKLAFMRFDDSPVPVFPIYHSAGQHGELERQRYPKAGDPNPYVQVGIVSVNDGKTVWTDFDPKADHYLAWPFWTPDSRTLTVQWVNRGQDTIRFYNCDAATGKKQQIYEEKQPAWVDFYQDLYYFQDGSGFLLRSPLDGWEHLYHYSNDGTLKRRLTEGEWRVDSIARVDEKNGWIYFMARPQNATWDLQLMRVKVDGTGLQRLTRTDGTHGVRLSTDGSHYIDTFSNITTPQQMALYSADGTLVRKLGDARAAAGPPIAWGKGELFTIPSGDGFNLPAYWVLPPSFDAQRRHPVIFSIYGGPDSGTVRNAFPNLQAHYWAQRGVITISVDHRGSGHFGKKGVFLMHRRLGQWEMRDLATAVDWLRARSFIAADRIGITGGSYGGYTTMMALTNAAGKFNYGQAGSPVTAWELYDSVYTERLMDTPAENPEGYKSGAVLTYIDRYQGGLRITHGTIDDNVHMQNSLQVIDWLTTHNKPFEVMLYPGSRHGLQMSQRPHANRESHDFWVRHLLDGRLPQAPQKVQTTSQSK
ncbi:MAG: S9 family peptidase [Acidobacteria bacterium]|nr:S9 family peptidase [Acidobacteriota bacterium]